MSLKSIIMSSIIEVNAKCGGYIISVLINSTTRKLEKHSCSREKWIFKLDLKDEDTWKGWARQQSSSYAKAGRGGKGDLHLLCLVAGWVGDRVRHGIVQPSPESVWSQNREKNTWLIWTSQIIHLWHHFAFSSRPLLCQGRCMRVSKHLIHRLYHRKTNSNMLVGSAHHNKHQIRKLFS